MLMLASNTPLPGSLSLHVVSLKPYVCQFRVAVAADAKATGQLHPALGFGRRWPPRAMLPRQAWLISPAPTVAPIS